MKDYTFWKNHFDAIIANEPWNENNNPFYEPINYIMGLPGKRLRAAFVLMAANLFDDAPEKFSNQGLALEVFHNFSLVHDDIMDQADLRRGAPTVHKKFNEEKAILAGDAMMIVSTSLLIQNLSGPQIAKITPVFNQAALEVCYGQQEDMNFEKAACVTLSEYENMINGKTAALVRACFEIGAILAAADQEDIKAIRDFGTYLGLAFQVKDDIIDTYSEAKVSGKKQGGDILENKKTYLSISLAEIIGWDNFNDLSQVLASDPEKKIKEITALYDQHDIKSKVEKLFTKYHQNAMECLDRINVEASRKSELNKLASILLNRAY